MDDLVSDFVIEAADALAVLQAGLARLSLRPGDHVAATDMLRRLHGLKGLCGFIGFGRAESLAHAAESLIAAIDERGSASAWRDLALVADALQRLSLLIGEAAVSRAEPEGDDHELITALELSAAVLHGEMADAATVRPPGSIPGLAHGSHASAAPVAERRARAPWCGLDTLARALGDRLGKRIDLSVGGDDLRVALSAAPALRTALIALVRNACDHGVETPTERREAGKPVLSMLQLCVRRTADGLAVDLVDDGRGLDTRRLRERAVAMGVLTPQAAADLDDEAAHGICFEAGISTAPVLTALSGRGLGLELVRREIARLGGEVTMSSTPGRGARFTLTLPGSAIASPASRRLRAA